MKGCNENTKIKHQLNEKKKSSDGVDYPQEGIRYPSLKKGCDMLPQSSFKMYKISDEDIKMIENTLDNWKWDAQTSWFWDTNRSPNLGQTTTLNGSQ